MSDFDRDLERRTRARYGRPRRRRTKRVSCIASVTPEAYEAIEDAAYLYGVTVQTVFRAALREWLRKNYRKMPFSL